MSEEQRTPSVFISYSHDSKEHKQWVLELAQNLQREGIEVVIDQWDLEYGDDVAKFMEKWVSCAERVLMICSERYVQKVDEGKGGVGYEAMIVTQELIRNLGTKKFIPVLRQTEGAVVLPKCVGTRLAVNLSDHPQSKEEFAKLIEQLRQLPPATKPPLGAGSPLQPTLAKPPDLTAFSNDPAEAYDQALAIARSGDLVPWRRLIESLRTSVVASLNTWRESAAQALPRNENELTDFASAGLAAYQPLFAASVAGVESGQEKFNRQSSLIHSLLEPNGWAYEGYVIVVSFPETTAWIFHSLVGAMHVRTGQMNLAIEMATQRVRNRYSTDGGEPLFLSHRLTGWPDSLKSCTRAWEFLWNLPKLHPWVEKAFGSEESFHESLCGYYLTLSWLEFVHAIKQGLQADIASGEYRLNAPAMFYRQVECTRGMHQILEDREALIRHAEKNGITAQSAIEFWPNWILLYKRWMSSVMNYPFSNYHGCDLKHFVEDIHR